MSGAFFGFPGVPSASANNSQAAGRSLAVPMRSAPNKFMPHSLAASTMPHGDNDGRYFSFGVGSSVSTIELRSAAGSVVWSVMAAAVNSAAVIIATGYIDYVEGRFYVLAHDNLGSTTTTYFAYISLATGAVTNLSTQAVGWYQGTAIAMSRAAQGSGDLRVYFGSLSGPLIRHTLSVSTGAITSTQSLLFGYGSAPVVSVPSGGIFGAFFVSADERVVAHNDNKYLHIVRGGGYGVVRIGVLTGADAIVAGGTFFANGASLSILNPFGIVFGPRHFSQANFLVWLHATADALGLPN